jgi:hypothetical protein
MSQLDNNFLQKKPNKPEIKLTTAEREGLNRLNNKLEKIAKELNQIGVPVDESCRLKIECYTAYPESKRIKDKNIENSRKKEYDKIEEDKKIGEIFEKLKTAFLYNHLSENFIICRTTFFDDFLHGVDNIILDKKTGNVVCAVDDVVAGNSKEYEDKKNKQIKVNERGGATLEYGLVLDAQHQKISLAPLKNVPLIVIALNINMVKKCLANFGSNNAEFDKNMLTFFANDLQREAELVKNICPKNSLAFQRIENFRKVIEEIIIRYNLRVNLNKK